MFSALYKYVPFSEGLFDSTPVLKASVYIKKRPCHITGTLHARHFFFFTTLNSLNCKEAAHTLLKASGRLINDTTPKPYKTLG